MHSEQERKEEKGMPILIAADNGTKVIMAKVVPNKGVVPHAVEVLKRMVKQLGIQEGDREIRQRAGDFSVERGGEERV